MITTERLFKGFLFLIGSVIVFYVVVAIKTINDKNNYNITTVLYKEKREKAYHEKKIYGHILPATQHELDSLKDVLTLKP